METETKGKKGLCTGVSLVLDMFYVHFAASHSCLIPQTSLHCRKVAPTPCQQDAVPRMQPFASLLSQELHHQGAGHHSRRQAVYLRLNHRKEEKSLWAD